MTSYSSPTSSLPDLVKRAKIGEELSSHFHLTAKRMHGGLGAVERVPQGKYTYIYGAVTDDTNPSLNYYFFVVSLAIPSHVY